MINKKLSRTLGPALGIMGFILAIGVTETTVFAESNVQANFAYADTTTSSDVICKDYSININKSQTQNGIKVTIDKVIGTKHKIKVTVKVENEKSFDVKTPKRIIQKITFGGIDNNSGSTGFEYPDDKTIIMTTTIDNDAVEYPVKGNLRLDMVIQDYKVNMGIDVAVDFSGSYNNVIEKDISVKMPGSNVTINKLEADIMGTRITYSEPTQDYSTASDYNEILKKTAIILKVGDKMYPLNRGASYEADDKLIMETMESKTAIYDTIKNQNDISIIPIVCNMSEEELTKINENEEKANNSKETKNNVSYTKSFEFSNGSKGQIYNIERNDNSVKVYCKGNSEKESLLMAATMEMNYAKTKSRYFLNYDSSEHMKFYKDSKDAFGYVVEFDDVEKDKAVEIDCFDSIIKQIDKFKIGDEIKIKK